MNQKKHPKNYIKEWREHRNFTLDELAQLAETYNQQVSKLETSKVRLTWEWMRRLAKPLNCDPADLVEGPPHKLSAEKLLVSKFRQLDENQQTTVLNMAKFLADQNAPSNGGNDEVPDNNAATARPSNDNRAK